MAMRPRSCLVFIDQRRSAVFSLFIDQVGVLGWAGLIALARRPRFDSAQRSLEAGVGVSGGEGGLVEVDNVCQNGLGVGMIVAQANHENGKAF
jgi:hypothetical protein